MRLPLAALLLLGVLGSSGCIVGPCVQQLGNWSSPGAYERVAAMDVGALGHKHTIDAQHIVVYGTATEWTLFANATDEGFFTHATKTAAGLQDEWARVSPALGLAGVELRDVRCTTWKGFPD